MPSALLFDVGDVLMHDNWTITSMLAARDPRVASGAARFRGPFAAVPSSLDQQSDEHWQAYLRGSITMVDYWNAVAEACGYADMVTFFKASADILGSELFAPDAVAFVHEAHAAGVPVGVLSNDLVRFSGRAWVDAQPIFQNLAVFVDATEFGARKPDPAIYRKAIEDFALPAEEIVFLDDTPYCVEGCRDVGMVGVHVDPVARHHGFDLARRLVGITPASDAQTLVTNAEHAYRTNDLALVMALFHPDVVIYWNGKKVASGLAEAAAFHQERLGFGNDRTARRQYRLRKTLRAADGDTVAGEWESSYVIDRPEGPQVMRNRAAEFMTLRYGLIIEWHAYSHRSEETT